MRASKFSIYQSLKPSFMTFCQTKQMWALSCLITQNRIPGLKTLNYMETKRHNKRLRRHLQNTFKIPKFWLQWASCAKKDNDQCKDNSDQTSYSIKKLSTDVGMNTGVLRTLGMTQVGKLDFFNNCFIVALCKMEHLEKIKISEVSTFGQAQC